MIDRKKSCQNWKLANTKMAGRNLTLVCLISVAISCGISSEKESIYIYAAISTSRVLNEFELDFEEQNPKLDLKINYASSSTLARQIDAGAPADIFISADTLWTGFLFSGRFSDKERKIIAINSLVVVDNRNEAKSVMESLLSGRKISVAEMEHVPAGRYARRALECLGIYSELEERIIPSMNVRIAFLNVQNRIVDTGVVYRSETFGSNGLAIFTFPKECSMKAVYDSIKLKSRPAVDLVFDELSENPALWAFNGFE